MHLQPQRTRKTVKSKAIVEDKDDDEVEIIGDVDVTMGSSDGPVTAASGAEAVRISLPLGFTTTLNRSFSQMAIDNLFKGEVEVKTVPKDKGKKRSAPKVNNI